jgi:GT2 family glycosyltransferase
MTDRRPDIAARFSVIIPNWNGRHHLEECLNSLASQTFRDFDTVLVDNASTDGSVLFVREHFPDVKIVSLHENTGFAGGVNAGIRASNGEYVVLLNNDTAVESGWLMHLNLAVSENPDIWLFASMLVNYYDRTLVDSAGDALDLCLGPYKIGEREPLQRHLSRRFIFGACGGGGCYKRELFGRIGLFDEDFFAYFEDTDLSFRANWSGFRCLSVPDAVIFHKVGGTSDAGQANRDRFDIMRRRNYIFLILKNYPLEFLIRYLPFILASHCLKFLANIVRGRIGVALTTQLKIAAGLPGMLQKRRRIMANMNSILNGFPMDSVYL